jgi:orotidine-5'-phosphate decarboxylase
MLRAAAKAAADAASRRNRERPLVIAVTVLTSLDAGQLREIGVSRDLAAHVVDLAKLAQECGLDGVVASPQEIVAIRAACGPQFAIVTPGIRPTEGRVVADDQARTMSPREALESGASYLVIGRPITAAQDARAAATSIAAQLRA